MEDFKPNNILYITDARQSLHFEQVFRVCELSGMTEGCNLLHLPNGTINGIDGKPYKEIVEEAREYIKQCGGFEKFAEWGLY